MRLVILAATLTASLLLIRHVIGRMGRRMLPIPDDFDAPYKLEPA